MPGGHHSFPGIFAHFSHCRYISIASTKVQHYLPNSKIFLHGVLD